MSVQTLLPTRYLKKSNLWAGAGILLIIIWSYLRSQKGGDFDVFLHAGAQIDQGNNPYFPPFVKGLQYFYSPFFAWALLPFSKLPWWIPEFCWLLFSAWCYIRCWMLIEAYLPKEGLSRKQYYFWVIGSTLVLFRFINDNVHMIQMTFFLLWTCMESVAAAEKGKNWKAGAVLGLGIAIKTMPLPFLAYFLYRNKLKAGAATIFFVAFYLLLPGLFLGFYKNAQLLQDWWGVINPGNAEHSIETDLGYHGLTALVPVYFTETVGTIPIPRNLVSWSPERAILMMNIARFLLVLGTLFFLRTKPFSDAPSPAHRCREVAYICLCIPLLFPHQQKYAFLLMLPAVAYILYWFMAVQNTSSAREKNYAWKGLMLLSVLVLTLTVRGVLGHYNYDVAQHFRVLSFGVLMLIPLLYACNPYRIESPESIQVNSPVEHV